MNSETAKRMAKQILETSGFVCGSLKDTVADKDIQWLENEIGNFRSKIEHPREKFLNHADKICRGGEPMSPITPESMGSRKYFDDIDDMSDGGRARLNSIDGAALSNLLASDSSPNCSNNLSAQATSNSGNGAAGTGNNKKWPPTRAIDESLGSGTDSVGASLGSTKHSVVIGLCLSRCHPTLGHPDTVTRQTAFDFNELQDRNYKFVSSTDRSGWLAGGGERGHSLGGKENGGVSVDNECVGVNTSKSEDSEGPHPKSSGVHKVAAPDKVHIPIIRINADSAASVDAIISALAGGEIFIPHVCILPEQLSVNGISPPDLVVRFGCERNDDINPEEWPNWCLEFLHNQLYDCFAHMGAQWTKRPFQITLARRVRWKTVKHMNKFFAHSEQVINTWREKGPQYLEPPPSQETLFGASREEILRPHGIYLIRNGVPTNYFAPNFRPPYTTKVTRSLIRNVISKSWDKKRRDWLLEPVPRMRTSALLLGAVCGCGAPRNNGVAPAEEKITHIRPMAVDFDPAEDSGDIGINSHNSAKHDVRSRRSIPVPANPSNSQQHNNHQRQERIEEDFDEMQHESYDSSGQRDGMVLSEESTAEMITTNRAQSSDESPDEVLQQPGHSSEIVEPQGTQPGDVENATAQQQTSLPSAGSKGVSFFDAYHDTRNRRRLKLSRDEGQTNMLNGEASDAAPHQNGTSGNFVDRERDRRIERQRERDSEKKRVDALERSLNEQNQKLVDTKAEKYARTKSRRREMRDRRQDENADRGTAASKNSPRRAQNADGVWQNLPSPSGESSNTSLAYSMDSTSLFRGVNTTDGGSVMTSGTENQSLLSYVTRSTMAHSRFGQEEAEDDISLSILESNSSHEQIPTDDELMAIGWAKALDPNSGSYYYFTLDRTKIVWENPLV